MVEGARGPSTVKDFSATLKRIVGSGAIALGAIAAMIGGAEAKVLRIVIDKVEAIENLSDPTIPLEKLRGRAYGELDPLDQANEAITDLKLAPRNADDKVEYISVFELTKPLDLSKATGLLWYDFVNRGRPLRAEHGVIQPWTYGHIHLVSGWQGDIAPTDTNVTVQVPVAKNPDGSAITGGILARLADSKPNTNTRALAVLATSIPYDAASLDTSKARLVAETSETRAGEIGPVKEIPPSDWAYADCTKTPFPGNPIRACSA